LRAFKGTQAVETSTKPSLIHWGSRPSSVFTAVILLTLGVDIALALAIYLAARTFW